MNRVDSMTHGLCNINTFKLSLFFSLLILASANAAMTLTSFNSQPAIPANIDVGQSITFNAVISGGSSPYTYNFLVTNSIGAIVGNYLDTNALTSNTFTWYPTSAYIGLQANVIITDSTGANTVNSISLSGLNVNPTLAALSINVSSMSSNSPSQNMPYLVLDNGQSVYIEMHWAGGSPPYNAVSYSSATSSCSSSSTTVNTIISSSNYIETKLTPANTLYYCFTVTDSASTPVASSSSASVKIAVNPALTGISLTSSNSNLISGQPLNLTASWGGGTPNYAVRLYESQTSQCNSTSELVRTKTEISSNTVSFNSIYPTSSSYYCALVSDSAVEPSLAYNIDIPSDINEPSGLSVSPSGKYLYVTNYGPLNGVANVISIINISTSLSVGNVIDPASFTANGITIYRSQGITFSPSGSYAYINNWGSCNLLIMNTSTSTITGYMSLPSIQTCASSTGSTNAGTTFTNSGKYAYVTNYGPNNVLIINTTANTIVGTILDGIDGPFGITMAPSGSYAYISNLGSSNVVIMNTSSNTIIGAMDSGFNSPRGIGFYPSGAYAFVANNGGAGNVMIINTATNSILGSMQSQFGFSSPQGISFSSSGNRTYIADGSANTISVLNTGIESSVSSYMHVNVQTPPPSPSSSSSSSPPSVFNVEINDNVYNSSASSTPVITAYLLSSSGKIISKNSYLQDQLPAIISVTGPEYVEFSYACGFSAGGATYKFANDVYGIGYTTVCGQNYTLSGGQRTVIYSKSPLPTLNSTERHSPVLRFVKECINSTYTAENSAACATEAQISTINNQLNASLYLNGAFVGATSTTITENESLPGSYLFTFKTVGNKNYTNASISYSFNIAMPITHTVISSIILNRSVTSKSISGLNLSANFSELINFTNENAKFVISIPGGSSGVYSVKVSNATNAVYTPPSGMSILSAVNISVFPYSPTLEVNASLGYQCNGISGSSVKPYLLKNATWIPITPFTVNAASCTIAFDVPQDPIVAIMENTTQSTNNLTTSNISSHPSTTTSSPTPVNVSANNQVAEAIAIIVIIVLIAVYLAMRHFRKGKRIFK